MYGSSSSSSESVESATGCGLLTYLDEILLRPVEEAFALALADRSGGAVVAGGERIDEEVTALFVTAAVGFAGTLLIGPRLLDFFNGSIFELSEALEAVGTALVGCLEAITDVFEDLLVETIRFFNRSTRAVGGLA